MQITTDRLLLREFVEDDWPSLLAYQSDPRYLRFYEWTERTEADVRAFVQMFLDHQQDEPRQKFQWAVCLRDEGRLIGNCGLRLHEAGSRVADVGYELAPEFWRKGYATEAARAVVAFGFLELNTHRIEAECVADNAASARVMQKAGLKFEGRLRQHRWYKGRWWDTLIYAILEDEWRALERKGDYLRCE